MDDRYLFNDFFDRNFVLIKFDFDDIKLDGIAIDVSIISYDFRLISFEFFFKLKYILLSSRIAGA